ncbi:hypothetical protein BABINDRAFT_174562 [Babjeviella inositovora NRRL Y-12698]|uniref:Rad21/Rec8-like protein N-terminal domain-containing protein n=1 Tax=Babjeviella inositovora NRRL Y-12698 TaxID=984486 RepID=A0A1E3QXZ9_9ASCO|nr:uncharacterized protein BABINDRAFT_174562 [Babjeviella inositovora NRRL Y-12698]ODQ81972.1 hypothetical protein BABINDRAFT_174562 [Babjeviella inositovora NRRL Y-12698]
MFFSQDLLLSEKSGVGTIWILATLGNNSFQSKVVKKDVLSASIPDACEIITNPSYSMALRLSSNLLYGVTLLYKQKVDYVYLDVSIARLKLQRDLFRGAKAQSALPDHKGIRARTLPLDNDPLFNISLDLLPVLNLEDLFSSYIDMGYEQDDRRTRIKLQDMTQNHNDSPLVQISDHSLGVEAAYHIHGEGQISTVPPVSHSWRDVEFGNPLGEDFLGNSDFEFDENGGLRNMANVEISRLVGCSPRLKPLSDFDQSIRQDFEMGCDFDIPEGSTLSASDLNGQRNDKTILLRDSSTRAVTLVVPNATKGPRLRKLSIDETTILSNKQLRGFRDQYLEEMAERKNKRVKKNETGLKIQALFQKSTGDSAVFNITHGMIFGPHITGKILGFKPWFMTEVLPSTAEGHGYLETEIPRGRRGSSSDYEIGRGGSNRKSSATRSSFGSITIPLLDDGFEPQDFDMGDFNVGTPEQFRPYPFEDFNILFPEIDDFEMELTRSASSSSSGPRDNDLNRSGSNPKRKRRYTSGAVLVNYPLIEEPDSWDDTAFNPANSRKLSPQDEKFYSYVKSKGQIYGKIQTNRNCTNVIFADLLPSTSKRQSVAAAFAGILQLASIDAIGISLTYLAELNIDLGHDVLKADQVSINICTKVG